jgi:hypothetical protein
VRPANRSYGSGTGAHVTRTASVSPLVEARLNPTAIFLHGAKYASDFWLQLGTLKLVAESGVRALAIDLPGALRYPKKPSMSMGEQILVCFHGGSEGAAAERRTATPGLQIQTDMLSFVTAQRSASTARQLEMSPASPAMPCPTPGRQSQLTMISRRR